MRRLIVFALLALSALTSSGCGPCLPGIPCPIAALAAGGRGGGSAPPGDDGVGPRIQILSPARAAMLDGDPQVRIFGSVTDASQVVALTVDDEPVTPQSDGKFTVDRVLQFGVNRFKAV